MLLVWFAYKQVLLLHTSFFLPCLSSCTLSSTYLVIKSSSLPVRVIALDTIRYLLRELQWVILQSKRGFLFRGRLTTRSESHSNDINNPNTTPHHFFSKGSVEKKKNWGRTTYKPARTERKKRPVLDGSDSCIFSIFKNGMAMIQKPKMQFGTSYARYNSLPMMQWPELCRTCGIARTGMHEKATAAVIAIHHARDSKPVILMTFLILWSLEKSRWYQKIILSLAQPSGDGDKIVETQTNYGQSWV